MEEHRIFYYSSCRPTQRSHSYITDSCFSLNWFPHSVQTFSTICLFCSVFFFIVYSPIRFLWFAVLIQQLFLRLIYNSVVRFVTLFRRNLLFCDRIQKSATNGGIKKMKIKMACRYRDIPFLASLHHQSVYYYSCDDDKSYDKHRPLHIIRLFWSTVPFLHE